MLLNILAVGAGGAIGSVCRYLFGQVALRGGGFPWGTMAVNVAGAFLMGITVAVAGREAGMDPRLLLFLKVGVCGGFTTFSAFSMEAVDMLQGGRAIEASAYIALSVALCACALALAQWIAK
ncbi:MAG: fluoride efflux transporter CrcB [Candidatus Methanoplasma sp.]|nr:fluoride efflux transporter CrcB [Candidatus Methanoplasma sp.]